MAPTSSHTFQKLKLDTNSAPHKPVASTFASIPRHGSEANGSTPSQLTAGLADPAVHYHSNGSLSKPDQNGLNGHDVRYDSPAVAVGSSEEEDDVEAQFRKRATSISFNNEVKLDSGGRLALEDPVPKILSSRYSRSQSTEGDDSEQEFLEIPFSQRKRMQHHMGESRYPLLQSTVDELARNSEYNDHVASLTSEATTASPPLEEVQTPLETPSEYLLSPINASSPIEFPPFTSRRNGPTRTRSYRSEMDGEGSLRRASRRSSGRSGRSLSSMSPAASFLSRYKPSETPLKPCEPDDEGQGIGYDGEYIIGKQIGYGGFSVVKEVTSIENGKRVVNAVKIVRKQLRSKSEMENEQIQTQFDHEVEIWRFLRHPYILPLLRVYTTDFATYCITKLNKGGTLFDLVRDMRRKRKNGLPCRLVKRYAYQLASAMRYLHNDVQVVHRDIKLENCLVDMTVPNAEVDGGDILLCDFGMADFVISDQRDGPEPHSIGDNQNIGPADTSTSIAGSLQYAAPELFKASGPLFSPAADIWAFGVVIYALITANLPFNEGLDIKTTTKILNGEWDADLIRGAEAAKCSNVEDVLELITGCLEMDPQKRWTVHDILECSWLKDCEQQFENVSRAWLADS